MIKLRRYLTVQEWAEFQDNVWRIRFVKWVFHPESHLSLE